MDYLGRDRRAARSSRHPGGDDRRARARLAVGRHDRPVALFARHRHPVCGRAVRGDRRLAALPKAGQLMSYLGLTVRRTAPVRRAARARSPRPARARPPALGRSGLALPPRAGQGPAAQAPPSRPARARPGDQRAAQQRLHRTWQRLDRSAASAARSSRSPSPANSPASAGPPPTPTNRWPAPRRSRRAAGTQPAPTRESIRDISVSNRPRGGHARSQTAGSHDETRSCGREGSAHNSLTARRALAGPAAPLDRHRCPPRRGHPVLPLDKPTP